MFNASYSTFADDTVRNITHGNAFNIYCGTNHSSVIGGIADLTAGDANTTGANIDTDTGCGVSAVTVSGVNVAGGAYGVRFYGKATSAGDWADPTKLVQDVSITGNTISGYTNAAVQMFAGVQRVSVAGNSFNAGAAAIGNVVSFPNDGLVQHVVVSGNVSIGGQSFLEAVNVPGLIVSGNFITGTNPTGTGNSLYSSAVWLAGSSASGSQIVGNYILNPGTPSHPAGAGIALDAACVNATLSNNTIFETRAGAARGMQYAIIDYAGAGWNNVKFANIVTTGTVDFYYLAAGALANAVQPVGAASPTFTGTVSLPSGITIGASVATGLQADGVNLALRLYNSSGSDFYLQTYGGGLTNFHVANGGNADVRGTFTAAGYKAGAAAGVTASGTSCTITAITGGIITAATCAP